MTSAVAPQAKSLYRYIFRSVKQQLPGNLHYLLLGFGVPPVGAFLAWLRIALGFHTKIQVIVGWLVGSGFAAWWSSLGRNVALPFFSTHPEYQWQLYGLTSIAVVFFIVQNGRRWLKELKEQRQLNNNDSGNDNDSPKMEDVKKR